MPQPYPIVNALPRKKLPLWYERVYRVVAVREIESEGRRSSYGPYPEDFDEDISELESESSGACHCASDTSECECDLDERDFMDEDSVYAGSDAEWYLEYKEMREERKRQLVELRKDHERAIEYHKAREDEVEREWAKLQQNNTRGIQDQRLNLELAHFNIYSSDFARCQDIEYDHPTSYIEFYWPDELGERTNKQTMGHIYIDPNITPSLEVFEAPEYAGQPSVDIGVEGSDENISVTFINQHLLKMAVPRSIACLLPPPSNTPELFEFVGISRHFKNKRTNQEKQKREEAEAKRRKQRDDSPRESWFEMNHPMGSWAQSSW
ncbi:hypothetical protein COCCADRAFT_10475 [Bipolaris zeicola 26-R-13]|uniref:Uncharacterized protein n=1 Tax=Cochliobolus carbonum (strain 26-R-13) TaxID=930089 RepID=W6XN94_COCC2|nr:uncharacterized protein COCCADRAFT_10475 [Bipolaris zeicola 26-R-13]EUC26730.1 hypothetical protein COCCADRAFT_10475 [Bipolaris zeicola 26-R-13]